MVADWDGPLKIYQPETLNFVEKVVDEIYQTYFKTSDLIHLGMDEVRYECWNSSVEARNYLIEKNYTTFTQLEEEYIQKTVNFFEKYKNSVNPAIWEDAIIDPNVDTKNLPKNLSIFAWITTSDYGTIEERLERYLATGLKIIRSQGFYLNYIYYGEEDAWYKYLNIPVKNLGDNELYGAEISLWGEYIDATNIEPRLWPRGSAAANTFWTGETYQYILEPQTDNNPVGKLDNDLKTDFHHFRCFLVSLGVYAQPIGPGGFCRHGEIDRFDDIDVLFEEVNHSSGKSLNLSFSMIAVWIALFWVKFL